MKPEVVCEQLVAWIKDKVSNAGAEGCVIGLSGGIDSAVASALCKRAFPNSTYGVIMSCHSNPQDAEHGALHANQFNIPFETVVLDEAYDVFLKTLGAGKDVEGRTALAMANIKPRMRMTTLYYIANKYNYLVVGTGNRSELTVGYYTKHGDGGVDLLPIANLVKQEVRELAKYLGVDQAIIDKPPSAGLWGGQTDENEMGITYADLDRYILEGVATPAVKERVDALHRCSQHKRELPPIAMIR